jgi:hypothetical protein
MAVPLVIGGMMAAGALAKAYASHKQGQSAAKHAADQAAAKNRHRDQMMGQYTEGARQGAQEMSGHYQGLLDRDPMYSSVRGQTYDQLGGLRHDQTVQDAIRGFSTGQQGQVHSYDAERALGQQGSASLAQAVDSGRGMRSAEIGESDTITLEQQAALRDQLGAAARGETPSLANQAMISGLERAAQQQAGLAAQQRGGAGSLLAQRQAQQMGGQAMQQAAREGAMMSLDERERARAQFGQQLGTMRAESTQRDLQQASFQQQMEQANLQKRLADAGLATNVNLANAAAQTGMSQFNVGQANQMALANAAAENQRRAMEAQARTGMSQFNVSRADDLARLQGLTAIDQSGRSLDMRRGIDQFNVGQDTRTQELNNAWVQNLLNQQSGALSRGAFAGADAAGMGLGAGHAVSNVAAPHTGAAIIGGIGEGLSAAAQSYSMTGAGGDDGAAGDQNHMTNPYINRTIDGLQNVLNR